MFVAFRNTCGFSLLAFERLTAAPQSKRQLTNKDINKEALHPKMKSFFPSGDPNRICMVMRAHNAERAREFIMRPNATPQEVAGHDAERARKTIMPRSAATQGAAP